MSLEDHIRKIGWQIWTRCAEDDSSIVYTWAAGECERRKPSDTGTLPARISEASYCVQKLSGPWGKKRCPYHYLSVVLRRGSTVFQTESSNSHLMPGHVCLLIQSVVCFEGLARSFCCVWRLFVKPYIQLVCLQAKTHSESLSHTPEMSDNMVNHSLSHTCLYLYVKQANMPLLV